MNRLMKVVHFNSRGIETAREMVRKLVAGLTAQLENVEIISRAGGSSGEMPLARAATGRRSHAWVELDESAAELLLRVGFSVEYGARNPQRVVDRMLGTLIAETLLKGEIILGQTIRLEALDGPIHFHTSSSR